MKVNTRIKMFQYDTRNIRMASIALWVAGAAWLTMLALGIPTGLGSGLDVTVMLMTHTVGYLCASNIIAWLLIKLPLPGFFTGALLYTTGVVYGVVHISAEFSPAAATAITAAVILGACLTGILIGMVSDRLARLRTRVISLLLIGSIAAAVIFQPAYLLELPFVLADSWEDETDESSLRSQALPDTSIHQTVQLEHPGRPGSYSYSYFTYGSGLDKHRMEFGAETTLLSQTVDASHYIDDWTKWRTMFWGFDENSLPLNGRVWMPDGDGPYPLVLIVHGNHTMEYFSDDGYAYLGELLASRGMIAISVDQNFFNYSNWSGIPDDNYLLRTWLLLQHIQEIDRFVAEPNNPFSGKADMQQIAIIGHSRGGQAAAMAADAARWFAEDLSLPAEDSYKIEAVIALAPTDVNVDKKAARLRDVYYLTLHGGQDADVNTQKSDEQYSRTTFTDPERFKASLFVESANHSYFNTSWGPHDLALPKGAFLNQSDTMDREAQQDVTKLYVAAFLETVFHGRQEYIDIFRDYQNVAEWLPESRYFSRFESGAFIPLTNFEHAASKTEAALDSQIVAEGFSAWEVESITDQNGTNKGTKGAILEWEDSASLSIELSETYRNEVLDELDVDAVLTFSIMNAEHELELVESSEDTPAEEPQPEIYVEFESDDGKLVSIALSDYVTEIAPMPETTYTIVPFLEDQFQDGKYKNNQIPVFQTVEIPLESLEDVIEEFAPDRLEHIRFQFEDGPAKVILDDIGFLPEIS